MILRWFVILIGVIITLVAISQIIAPAWWLNTLMPPLMALPALRIMGIVVIAIGAVLTVAALSRDVGLTIFVLILGLVMLVGGILLVLNPAWLKDATEAFITNRSTGVTATRVSGIVRMLIGIALIYAGLIGWPRRDEV